MTTPGQTVGQRVRLARVARGYGVNELDRLLGVTQGYVSRLEGSGREPRADTLRKLAQALGVGLEWLATGEGEPGAAAPPAEAPSTPVPTPEGADEGVDPYPNRSRAVALLGHNLDPRARAVLRSYRFRSGGGRDADLPLELWLDEAKNLQRQVRRLDREFAAIEREGQAGEGEGEGEGDEPTGWTPVPHAGPERLQHARRRVRPAAGPFVDLVAALSLRAPTPAAVSAPKLARQGAKARAIKAAAAGRAGRAGG